MNIENAIRRFEVRTHDDNEMNVVLWIRYGLLYEWEQKEEKKTEKL